jgi:MscS family membrane protein
MNMAGSVKSLWMTTWMKRLGLGVCLLSLFCVAAWPQAALPKAVSASAVPAQPEAPKDSLGRATPRGTVLGFLTAARDKNYDLAAEYLNTHLHGKAAADLAQELSVVLDQRLPARLGQLSDNPEGSQSDPLNPNRELVGTITSSNGNVDIVLERVDRSKSDTIWLFSSKTLESIPDVYADLDVVSANEILPGFLVNTQIAGIKLYELIAVLVGLPLIYLFATLLNRLISPLAGGVRRRVSKRADLPDPQVLPGPLRILLIAIVIRWGMSIVGLPLLARLFWSSAAAVMTVAAIVWILILLNSRAERYFHVLLRKRNLAGTVSVLRLGRRIVDVLLVFAGALVILHIFGVKVTAALAGLGVGGIAVALAAQKTLENVIGGVSLIFDQVVRVGDSLKVGDTTGTVEEVGLRSIRIRTLDRTVVSVPNGQIATMSIETYSARDKFWFHHLLGLRYGTTAAQMHSVVDNIRSLLLKHTSIERDSVRVRLLSFGTSSLDVDVYAYVLGRDWNHFLEIQEGLLFSIMEIVGQAGTQLALPSQAMYLANNLFAGGATPSRMPESAHDSGASDPQT